MSKVMQPVSYRAPLISDRISRQQASFTLTQPPFEPLERLVAPPIELVKITIPVAAREKLLRKVISFGVDRSTLFPDLDGVASHVSWMFSNAALAVTGEPSFHLKFAELRQMANARLIAAEQVQPGLGISGESAD